MRKIDADNLKTRFIPRQSYFTEAILQKIDTAPNIEQPQIMTLKEVTALPEVVWIEGPEQGNIRAGLPYRVYEYTDPASIEIHVKDGFESLKLNEYDKTWRCWTEKPAKEQMEAEKGEGIQND